MPGEAFAGGFGFGIVRAVEDGQVQGVRAFAAVGVLVGMGVNSRCRVRFAVPSEALAGGFDLGIEGAVKDGQV